MVKNVLLVDDEPPIQRVLAPVLRADGWNVFEAANAAEALKCSAQESIDVVLLDLGLPDADGKEIIPALRNAGPLVIIVLSARHQETEKVAALDAGADDYVDKPFNIDVLRARIRAAERRLSDDRTSPQNFRAGTVELSIQTHEVLLEGEPVKLSPKEFELLKALISHAGQVVTHRRLLIAGWGSPSVDQQYLRGYIALLRQKLEADPSEPSVILSEPGVGYRLALGGPRKLVEKS
jgi:two-component system KDP operon response regulator KdpE